MKRFIMPMLGAILVLCGACSGDKNQFTQEIQEATLYPAQKDGKVGYIDSKGEFAIPCEYTGGDYFHEGLALVQITGESDSTLQKSIYINEKGERAFSGEFVSATDFSEGIAWVAKADSMLVAIDTKGKKLFSCPDAYQIDVFINGYAQFKTIDQRCGIINKKGDSRIMDDSISGMLAQGGGIFYATCKSGAKRLLEFEKDKFTELPISRKLQLRAWDKDHNLGIVKQGDKYGVADKEGKLIINPRYSGLQFDGNLLLFCNDKDKYGWIDLKGKEIIPAKYIKTGKFYRGDEMNDYVIVSTTGNKYQVIDRKGETVIKPKYDKMMNLYGPYFAVHTEAGLGIANASTGELTCEPQFENIGMASKYILFATSGENKWCVIDLNGTYVGENFNHVFSGVNVQAHSQMFDCEGMAALINKISDECKKDLDRVCTLGNLIQDYNISDYAVSRDNVQECVERNIYNGVANYTLYACLDKPGKTVTQSYWSRSKAKINKNALVNNFTLGVGLPKGDLKKVVGILESKYKFTIDDSIFPRSALDNGNYFYVIIVQGKAPSIEPLSAEEDDSMDEDFD